jgi:hypothetical protein
MRHPVEGLQAAARPCRLTTEHRPVHPAPDEQAIAVRPVRGRGAVLPALQGSAAGAPAPPAGAPDRQQVRVPVLGVRDPGWRQGRQRHQRVQLHPPPHLSWTRRGPSPACWACPPCPRAAPPLRPGDTGARGWAARKCPDGGRPTVRAPSRIGSVVSTVRQVPLTAAACDGVRAGVGKALGVPMPPTRPCSLEGVVA